MSAGNVAITVDSTRVIVATTRIRQRHALPSTVSGEAVITHAAGCIVYESDVKSISRGRAK